MYDTYIDDGYTGTDFNRPGFQRMLEDMKNGIIECIIVKDLSRLGRNYIEVGNYIEQIFPIFNIRFIAINDNIDSFTNPSSSNTILIPFKNLINDEYARDTSIKIRTALNGRKKKGEFVGAFPAYGYIKSKEDNHKLIVDEEAANIVKKIFEWHVNQKMGCLKICHKLNESGILNPTGYKIKKLGLNYHNSKSNDYFWTVSTVRNILKNDIYIGNMTQGKRKVKSYKIHKLEQVPEEEWITVENMHKPIIDKDTFERAQRLRENDTRVEKSGNISIWAGILKCGDCGKTMHKKISRNKNGNIYEYYICGTYRKKSNHLCTKHTIRIGDLQEAVLQTIQYQIKQFVNVDELVKRIDLKIEKENKQEKNQHAKYNEIEKVEKLKKILYEDWKNNYITKEEYVNYKKDYDEQIESIKENIISMQKQQKEELILKRKKLKWLENFKKEKNITELDRNVIEELIDKIEIYENSNITIFFKFDIVHEIL